jgi:hypothetical protein
MKTIRLSRQGFPNESMHSWLRFFIFVLSKKYNVIVDAENPDLVIHSNLYYDGDKLDTQLKTKPISYDRNDPNKKFLFVSGEVSNFELTIRRDNHWAIGYQKINHHQT